MDESCTTEAIEKLKSEGVGPRNGEIVWLKLDLRDIRGTKLAAEEFLRKEKRLDILGSSHTGSGIISCFSLQSIMRPGEFCGDNDFVAR